MHQELDREERVSAEEYMRHPPPSIINANGEAVVEIPFGTDDGLRRLTTPSGLFSMDPCTS